MVLVLGGLAIGIGGGIGVLVSSSRSAILTAPGKGSAVAATSTGTGTGKLLPETGSDRTTQVIAPKIEPRVPSDAATDVTQTFRVLAIMLKEGADWKIVQTQWSNGGPVR